MTEDERLDAMNAALAERLVAMEKAQEHDSGRPVYPVTAAEYQSQLDENTEAVSARLSAMAQAQADQLAQFPPAPAAPPKAKKGK